MPRVNGSAVAVIPAAGSLSANVYLGSDVPYAVVIPNGWTAANLTFQGSVDGVNFFDLFTGDAGTEAAYTITNTSTTGRLFAIDGTKFMGLSAFRIRSGTAGVPVAQGAGATLQVGLRDTA
jgi:hypothetical protein